MVDLKSIIAKCKCTHTFCITKKNDFKLYSGDDTFAYLSCPSCGSVFRMAIMLFKINNVGDSIERDTR
jgi:NAD-dependent SIR2 family protein deacetylase